jgi:hypothetical protein
MKIELLTNATVVEDAIRFVSQKSEAPLKPSSGSIDEDDNEESNKPDYNHDEDQRGKARRNRRNNKSSLLK